MRLSCPLAIAVLALLAVPGAASAQSSPFAPWDGSNPFNCVEQDVGTGTDYPDPDADPFCVRFDKTNQNVTGFGIVEFTAQEPARVAAATPKCFYYQHDEWRGTIDQGAGPELWHWEGRYFFDKAKGIGGIHVVDFRIGGQKQDATPWVPPEYHPYFDESGGGGVMSHMEWGSDPRCAEMVASEEGRAAVYRDTPRFGDCAVPGGKVRARKVGRARIGAARKAIRRKVDGPRRGKGSTDRWCVVGGGKLEVKYRRGRAARIRTTNRGHAWRAMAPRARVSEVRSEMPVRRRERFDRGRVKVFEAARRHGRRIYIGARNGRILWLEMLNPRLARRPG